MQYLNKQWFVKRMFLSCLSCLSWLLQHLLSLKGYITLPLYLWKLTLLILHIIFTYGVLHLNSCLFTVVLPFPRWRHCVLCCLFSNIKPSPLFYFIPSISCNYFYTHLFSPLPSHPLFPLTLSFRFLPFLSHPFLFPLSFPSFLSLLLPSLPPLAYFCRLCYFFFLCLLVHQSFPPPSSIPSPILILSLPFLPLCSFPSPSSIVYPSSLSFPFPSPSLPTTPSYNSYLSISSGV